MTAPPELTPSTAALFPLPADAPRGENICSMVHFASEYRRLMDTLRITRIAEIGSETGLNTAELLRYAKGRGAKLIAVDPAESRFPFATENEPDFTFFRETSAEFLARPIAAEALFLDGDHNYATVLADLQTIHRRRAETGVKILFLHDVSWPWARRDLYYDPARIANPRPCHADRDVSPYTAGSPGLPPAGYMTADEEGGPENGVLTAAEDFLARHDGWDFRRIPVLYGIGILVCRENLAPEERAALFPLLDGLDSHRELFAALELNRVENLCRIAGLNGELRHAGEVWHNDQGYIGELHRRLARPMEQDREIRQLTLRLPEEAWRGRDSRLRCLLPGGLRNRRRLKEARRLLDSGAIGVLSLDLFDTLLLRDFTAELERFAVVAKALHRRFLQHSAGELYEARALAHQMAYRSVTPVQGCREASAERIFTIMARILGLPADAVPALMAEELDCEAAHLRVSPAVRELLKGAHDRGIAVIAVSDMYWSGRELAALLEHLLPAEAKMIRKVYSSSDFGVSKASGELFARVLWETGCAPEAMLHLGDDLQADFRTPFVRYGIRSIWLPRSDLFRQYCRSRQRHRMRDLIERNILHGL